jgi:polysaccharide export outer membrane protein
MTKYQKRLSSLFCALLLLSVLSALPHGALAQATPAAVASPAPAPAMATQVPDDYVIGPGDSLQVYVFRNPELTVTVPVRPDGKISTPLVEDMVAVGKTPSALARDIENVLSQYVRSPQVNVIVTQAQSASSKVQVIGQVLHPQSVPYRAGMKVLDAVLAVGGLSEFAAGNRSVLVRMVDGKEQRTKIKLDSLLNHGDMKQNLSLRPNDTLVIPQSRF